MSDADNQITEVSIHAPHARGDDRTSPRSALSSGFNPRPSCEGRPLAFALAIAQSQFQSTPLMRGATLRSSPALQFNEVSIHAPHARGDNQQLGKAVDARCFNPRPSCEGRPGTLCTMSLVSMFQSTPLMRGATCGYRRCGQWLACFNPRPSCEGRPVKTTKGFTLIQFQSTPLMRGATRLIDA